MVHSLTNAIVPQSLSQFILWQWEHCLGKVLKTKYNYKGKCPTENPGSSPLDDSQLKQHS